MGVPGCIRALPIVAYCFRSAFQALFQAALKFPRAILDRIVHNAHRLQLRGDSLRKQKAPKIAPA